MSAPHLDRLIRESEEAIQRLDAIQKQRHHTPILQRIKAHFAKNSGHLTNVLLAGSVLAVALGRLAQKQEHETAREEWQAAQRKLEAEKAAAEQRAAVLLSSTEALAAGLEEAAEARRRDLPQIVRQQLDDWRQRLAAAQQPAEAAASKADGGGGGGKIMI